MEIEKVNMKNEDFIDWYFSDLSDLADIGYDVKAYLKSGKEFSITSQFLLDHTSYIPGWLTDGDEDVEYNADQVNLI